MDSAPPIERADEIARIVSDRRRGIGRLLILICLRPRRLPHEM